MQSTESLACGDKPRFATAISELACVLSGKLEQELVRMVERVDEVALTAQVFQGFIGELRNALCAIGREALEQVLLSKAPAQQSIEIGGEKHRFRGMVEKEWLTCFGKVQLPRRTYRADGVGNKTIVPLDDCCGLSFAFATATTSRARPAHCARHQLVPG